MNVFQGTGNLGSDPEKKMVNVQGEERPVVELRVFFERSVPDGAGGFKESGGFWRTVSVWKEGLGDRVLTHLKSGTKVFVQGQEVASQWKDEHSQDRESYDVVADYIAADLIGVAAITYQARRDASQSTSQLAPDNAAQAL